MKTGILLLMLIIVSTCFGVLVTASYGSVKSNNWALIANKSCSSFKYKESVNDRTRAWSLDSEILVQNITDHGWVMKVPQAMFDNENLTSVAITRDPTDDRYLYFAFANYSEGIVNRTLNVFLLRLNTSYFNISGKNASVYYEFVANLSLEINRTYKPYISAMDMTIMQNKTLMLGFTVSFAIGVKRSILFVAKYLNVSEDDRDFIYIDYMDQLFGSYEFYAIDIKLASEGNNTVMALPLGYYVNISGIPYTYYGIYFAWYSKSRKYEFDATWTIKPKEVSDVYLIDNISLIAYTAYVPLVDQDFIRVTAWNISLPSNSNNISDMITKDVDFAGHYQEFFQKIPELKHISMGLFHNGTHIHMVIVWEGHTDFDQKMFYAITYTFYNTTGNATVDVSVKSTGVLWDSRYASNINALDINLRDQKLGFIYVDYNPEIHKYTPRHILFSYNFDTDTPNFLGPYDLRVGSVKYGDMRTELYPNGDIYGIVRIPIENGNRIIPIVIFNDTDKDGLGNWEEENVFDTLYDNPDSDNGGAGDGINDGAELFIYNTSPLKNDTDGDGLDDKFELEVRPTTYYPEYGNITNLYRTNPRINDTDADNITDYQEVTGNYYVDGRKGYPTNPIKADTDSDGLSDWKEIFVGVIYFVNSTNATFIAYPNATLQDTDNDNITDNLEARRQTDPTSNDTDGDGLSDWEEFVIYKTNPRIFDTDGDGLSDGSEILLYNTSPRDKDTDDDRLLDGEEVTKYNTSPLLKDTDSDGISDGDEVMIYGTNPLSNDTDRDNISDGAEIMLYRTNPNSNDTDGDGLSDYAEIMGINITGYASKVKTDPLDNDTDKDGLNDGEEVDMELDPTLNDTDGDGLSDYEEVVIYNTDPLSRDTDGDMLIDSQEITYNTDPLSNDSDGDTLSDYEEVVIYNTDPLGRDTDGDGLSDYEEIQGINLGGIVVFTDPLKNDTDGDGLGDKYEVDIGTDPTSSDSDGDLINDYDEIYKYSTNPLSRDSDNDTVGDYDEIYNYYTDPTNNDSDSDRLLDGEEIWGLNISGIGLRKMNPLKNDTDGDDLSDYEEAKVYLSDPTKIDTDSDGLTDSEEVNLGTSSVNIDTDRDSLSDRYEVLIGTNPLKNDTDGDGLSDGIEVNGLSIEGIGIRKTNPLSNDTDSDNISDYEEVYIYHTDPTSKDTDNDNIGDYDEIHTYSTDPNRADTDSDGLLDGQEIIIGTDPKNNDTDNDGLSDYDEYAFIGTYPTDSDTDDDTLLDGYEVEIGTDPLKRDTDGDGLEDGDELNKYHTNVTNPDTDGDGLSDWEEIRSNSDPNKVDTDGDGLSDYEEIRIYHTDPRSMDSDKDGIPDSLDLLFPTTPDWVLVLIIIVVVVLFYARSYGVFRNWKKDIIAVGLSDAGGILMFVIPEDFQTKYDASLISSGLLGIHTMTSEITGRELESVVLSGELPVFVKRGEYTIMWAFIRKEYPRLVKKLEQLHEELEKNYADILSSWSGMTEEVEDIKYWIKSRLGLEKIGKEKSIEIKDEELISDFEREFGEV